MSNTPVFKVIVETMHWRIALCPKCCERGDENSLLRTGTPIYPDGTPWNGESGLPVFPHACHTCGYRANLDYHYPRRFTPQTEDPEKP